MCLWQNLTTIARVISLVRRFMDFNEANLPSLLTYHGLSINRDERSIQSDLGSFELPPKEFDVLIFCVEHQGKILTKQMIYEAVWGEPYVYDDSNIMAIISRLRKKIEKDPSHPHYIQTIKGIGYRFNKEV